MYTFMIQRFLYHLILIFLKILYFNIYVYIIVLNKISFILEIFIRLFKNLFSVAIKNMLFVLVDNINLNPDRYY